MTRRPPWHASLIGSHAGREWTRRDSFGFAVVTLSKGVYRWRVVSFEEEFAEVGKARTLRGAKREATKVFDRC